MPMGPHPGLPGIGGAASLLGYGAGLGSGMPGGPGGPHPGLNVGAHPLLKPADLHSRESIEAKRPASINNEERLVGIKALLLLKVLN